MKMFFNRPLYNSMMQLFVLGQKNLKYGTNHDENLLELYGNIKEPYPWGQGHYIHICKKKM